MKGFIDGVDFINLEPMKYWSFSANTDVEVRRSTIRNAIFSEDYIGSLKVDGFYQRLIKDEDGQCYMIARSRNVNGEVVDKVEWVPQIHEWMSTLPNGTCFLAEAYLPNQEGSKNVTSILGCLKEKSIARQTKTPLHFSIFDVMAYDNHSYLKTAYIDRAKCVTQCAKNEMYQNQFIHWVQFYTGKELWVKLQEYLDSGREGMVIMKKDAIVYQKRTPARVSIKIKKELADTIDCFFTGETSLATRIYTGKEIETWCYWENEINGTKYNKNMFKEYQCGEPIVPVTKNYFYGWAGSLEIGVFAPGPYTYTINGTVCKDVKIVPIGWLSNVPEVMRADPKSVAFLPMEVTAMELDYGIYPPTLRHGRMKNFRPDLSLNDCRIEKIV